MKRSPNFQARRFTLLLLTGSLCVGRLIAQGADAVSAGKFTLPFEVRWGQAILPVGRLHLHFDSATFSGVLTVRGTRNEHARDEGGILPVPRGGHINLQRTTTPISVYELSPCRKKRLRECGMIDAVVDFFGVQAGWQEFYHPRNGHAHFRGDVVRQGELKLRKIFLEFLSGGFLEFP